jgi:hypothetical protein
MVHAAAVVLATAGLWAWAVAHQLAVGWVVAVLIERLPPPDAQSGKIYTYIYSVLQVFAANTRRSWDAVKTGGNGKTQP